MNKYRIAFDVGGCDFEIKLNDVVIQKNAKGSSIITEVPVNHWLFDGFNTISVKANPVNDQPYGPGAHINVSFFIGLDKNHKEQELFTLEKELSGVEEFKEKELKQVLEERFKTSLIQELPVIDITDLDIVKALFETCKTVHTHFKNQDKEAVLDIFSKRQLDLSHCYDNPPDFYANGLEESIEYLFGNEDYRLLGFIEEKLRPEICMYGKLATLMYYQYDKPIVNYSKRSDKKVMKSFPVFFALDENNDFFICR